MELKFIYTNKSKQFCSMRCDTTKRSSDTKLRSGSGSGSLPEPELSHWEREPEPVTEPGSPAGITWRNLQSSCCSCFYQTNPDPVSCLFSYEGIKTFCPSETRRRLMPSGDSFATLQILWLHFNFHMNNSSYLKSKMLEK